MNVAVDTNVLISGLLWFGRPHEALEVILHQHTLVQSRHTIEEFSLVIQRPRFVALLARRGERPESLVEALVSQADLYEISGWARKRAASIPITDDADRIFLELALESNAGWLVSGDRHILAHVRMGRTRIGRVADFLRAHGSP